MRPEFGLFRLEGPTDPGIEFHPSYGDWTELLQHSRFEIEDLIEVRPSADATARWHSVNLELARQWPCEEIGRPASAHDVPHVAFSTPSGSPKIARAFVLGLWLSARAG